MDGLEVMVLIVGCLGSFAKWGGLNPKPCTLNLKPLSLKP